MERINAVLSMTVLFSCSAPTLIPNPHHPSHVISGTVVSRNGQPAPYAVAIITRPSTSDEIAFTYTNSTGHFMFKTSESKVSLSTATSHGWAFLPNIDTDTTDLKIQLKEDCTVFQGEIELDDPKPLPAIDPIRFYNARIAALFGINVTSARTFDACLPNHEYYTALPENFAERTILTSVPPVRPLKIRAVTRKYSTAPPPVILDLIPQTQAQMVANIRPSLRLLGLAETNHGTADYFSERLDLSVALVERHGFSFIMIEAGYGEVLALDDYIKGANLPLRDAIGDLGYWMWNTKDFMSVLARLRALNSTRPISDAISIIGIDVQTTKGAVLELMRDPVSLASNGLSGVLPRLLDERGKGWLNFSFEEKAQTRRGLEALAASRDAEGIASSRNRRSLAARSILLCLDVWEQTGHWDENRARDKGMAQMATEVLSLDGRPRGTVWAHIGHLSREFVVGSATMGAHLAASLGDHYQVWALLGFEGAARARSPKGKHELLAHSLPPAPDYSVEAVLHRSLRARGLSISYWDLHQKSSSRKWLRGLHWLREIGGVFLEKRGGFDLYDLSALDGIVLFRRISPSIPLTFTAS